jgi:coproporphyrinogen III oxidase
MCAWYICHTHTHVHLHTTRRQVAGKSWYGGGCDLTPFYVNVEDATAFHTYWRDVCGKYQPGLYTRLKEWCDK